MNHPSNPIRSACAAQRARSTAVWALLCGAWLGGAFPAGVHAAQGEREVLYYRNPMNPAITSPVPAKDEMGMDYIPVYANAAGEAGVVTIDPVVVQNLGVVTAPVTRAPLPREIDTVGYVDYDEQRVTHVHLRAEGWIEDLRVKFVGDRVEAGSVLFAIYSPALVNAQEELLQALRVGQKGLIDASRQRLRLLGVDAQQIHALERNGRADARVLIRAHQSGVVTELNVREGMYVTPETIVMSLADLSSVWLIADVVERQSQWVEVGQHAEARLPYRAGDTFEGRVEFVYPSVSAQTRTLRARLRFDNPGELLKPNMYVNVRVFAGPAEPVLSVPQQALIRTGRASRVVVALGGGRFRAQPVEPGIESGDRVEIREGLNEGEQVVVSGQFLIDSEASVQASALRLHGDRPTAPAPDHAAHATPQPAEERTAPDVEPIHGMGVVTDVMAGHRMLTIDHEPIEDLGWPAMEMDFTATGNVDLSVLKAGDHIHFTLVLDAGGGYRVDTVHVME